MRCAEPLGAVVLWVRRALRRFGIDLHSYPRNDGLARLLDLASRHPNLSFVDVGASVGLYGLELRHRGFQGRIISLEPVESSFLALAKRASKDPLWEVQKFAAGDSDGMAEIHVSSNNAESSSLLPMRKRHVEAFAESCVVGEEFVEVQTLDQLLGNDKRFSVMALKLDVQGFELQVLNGAQRLFHEGRVVAVQIEVSLVPLYEGGADAFEVQKWLESRGFELVFVKPGFSDSSWRLLQMDLFYFRFGANARVEERR